jgi:hypothetical protein
MADLEILAVRVECGTGDDAFLDADIHEVLFGVVDAAPFGITYRDAFDKLRGRSHPYRFTSSVEDAQYALPGPSWPEWQVTRRLCTGYHANVGIGQDGVGCDCPARALTAAGLRARAALPKTTPSYPPHGSESA